MRHYLNYNKWTLLVLLLIVACAQMGVPTPDTFNQQTAIAIASVTAIRQSATQLLNAGKLSPQDGENVLAATDAARAGIAVASEIAKTDLTAAEGKLAAVTAILSATQTYLGTKQ